MTTKISWIERSRSSSPLVSLIETSTRPSSAWQRSWRRPTSMTPATSPTWSRWSRLTRLITLEMPVFSMQEVTLQVDWKLSQGPLRSSDPTFSSASTPQTCWRQLNRCLFSKMRFTTWPKSQPMCSERRTCRSPCTGARPSSTWSNSSLRCSLTLWRTKTLFTANPCRFCTTFLTTSLMASRLSTRTSSRRPLQSITVVRVWLGPPSITKRIMGHF